MTTLTLDDVLKAYGPLVASWPKAKGRDPIEYKLLQRVADPLAGQDPPVPEKPAGARPRP